MFSFFRAAKFEFITWIPTKRVGLTKKHYYKLKQLEFANLQAVGHDGSCLGTPTAVTFGILYQDVHQTGGPLSNQVVVRRIFLLMGEEGSSDIRDLPKERKIEYI